MATNLVLAEDVRTAAQTIYSIGLAAKYVPVQLVVVAVVVALLQDYSNDFQDDVVANLSRGR